MRIPRVVLAVVLAASGALCSTALADGQCTWRVTPNLSTPGSQSVGQGDIGYLWSWWWSYSGYADEHRMDSRLTAAATRCYSTTAQSCSGNGLYTIQKVASCTRPIEDIEANARNEFIADAMIDDSVRMMALGEMRIRASSVRGQKGGALDCHSAGAVEATSSGHGEGDSGVLQVVWGPAQVKIPLFWSTGGATSRVFKDSDAGTGGRSPEVFTMTTTCTNECNVGWGFIGDSGESTIHDAKSELTVYGTCDGDCRIVVVVLHDSTGY